MMCPSPPNRRDTGVEEDAIKSMDAMVTCRFDGCFPRFTNGPDVALSRIFGRLFCVMKRSAAVFETDRATIQAVISPDFEGVRRCCCAGALCAFAVVGQIQKDRVSQLATHR